MQARVDLPVETNSNSKVITEESLESLSLYIHQKQFVLAKCILKKLQVNNTLTKENCDDLKKALHDVIKINFQDFSTELIEVIALLLQVINQKKKEIVIDTDFFLHKVVEHNNKLILHDLLKMDFDINQKNKFGLTAYQVAYAIDGFLYAIFLIERKLSQNKIDELKKNPPLITAVKTGNIDCVKYLLDIPGHPNLPNKTDENGDTLLHLATKNKNLKMINLLLEKGANPTLCDRQNRDVLSIACKQFKQTNLPILQRYIQYAVNNMNKSDRLNWFHEHDLNPSYVLNKIDQRFSMGILASTQPNNLQSSQQENKKNLKLGQ